MSADRPFEGELKERAEPPGVSIVIPAYNEESVIRQCLIAAIYQSVPAKEIIVVDNLSKDRTAKIVRRMQQEYPESPIILLKQADVQGLIPTRNYGLNSATGDIIGRIDADSVLEPDWVEQVQKAFADPTVQAATGPVVYYDMPMRRFGLKADDKMRQLMLRLAKHQYHFLFGSNMALRRSAWETIRDEACLDEKDEMHEDIDLSLHLAEHDLRIQYWPQMVSGMSARRLEDSPRDYRYYVTRFDRTYKAHNVKKMALKAPMVVFFSVYFPAKLLRAIHAANGVSGGVRRGGL
ncbi:glycosyltransferase family 2 protein [Arthrobacter sp. TES]|uniref:glycosyltransferase n=1 Tax=Paenarthrobacter ureafaciens TaxID=37931 RepID=UPI0003983179|nr:glycosyltransferase family 2 protein [Paenarthrobacter ureafaciens]AOY73387.1 glycosyl transferase [Arthrobacter sp. ZXY-2]ERI36847.1 glycosyl transferase [Arthrobacter sp. AK-YN10]QOI65369.1 glycosyltransferase family 2 protein [Arthrobacter sp. TES]MCX8455261.1 glycosyltransferase family 2 protein [Paenarthrobacter ureafaciens]MCY0975214.1 glycosyltransferase family 2 protein [Paenarthrobacter ureafaciens]